MKKVIMVSQNVPYEIKTGLKAIAAYEEKLEVKIVDHSGEEANVNCDCYVFLKVGDYKSDKHLYEMLKRTDAMKVAIVQICQTREATPFPIAAEYSVCRECMYGNPDLTYGKMAAEIVKKVLR